MKLGFIVTKASAMDASWTTVQMAIAALQMGHRVGFIDRGDITIQSDGNIHARAHWFETTDIDDTQMALLLQTRKARRLNMALWSFDQLFLRTHPLSSFLQTIGILAKDRGVPIVNDPVALMRTSSKTWLATRPGLPIPKTLITSSQAAAEMFFQRQAEGVILKPDAGAGGQHVKLIAPGEYDTFHGAFRNLLRRGGGRVVVQANVGQSESREKRLMWLDGVVIGGYQRARAPGEFRHNLSQGAEPEPLSLSKRDKDLIAPLSPHLLEAGIRLAGIDLLGPYILEVNVLNPGGAFHADRLNQTSLAQTIVRKLLSS